MLFTTETISNKEIESINNFFNEFESVETVSVEEAQKVNDTFFAGCGFTVDYLFEV